MSKSSKGEGESASWGDIKGSLSRRWETLRSEFEEKARGGGIGSNGDAGIRRGFLAAGGSSEARRGSKRMRGCEPFSKKVEHISIRFKREG